MWNKFRIIDSILARWKYFVCILDNYYFFLIFSTLLCLGPLLPIPSLRLSCSTRFKITATKIWTSSRLSTRLSCCCIKVRTVLKLEYSEKNTKNLKKIFHFVLMLLSTKTGGRFFLAFSQYLNFTNNNFKKIYLRMLTY